MVNTKKYLSIFLFATRIFPHKKRNLFFTYVLQGMLINLNEVKRIIASGNNSFIVFCEISDMLFLVNF